MAKVLINVLCFVFPVILFAYENKDKPCYLACIAFVVNGLLIGSDRHSYLIGVRRENWFHYVLGTSMAIMVFRLCRVFNPGQ